jgi:hypothetical protein
MTDGKTQSNTLRWDIGIVMVLAGLLLFVHNLNASGNPFGFLPLILTALGAGQLLTSEDKTIAGL